MVTITRLETSDPRMAKIVIHNGVVYLSGQVGMSSDNSK
jgi:enamine deaminase RidA (YjgF/YER057c/UK114 family)